MSESHSNTTIADLNDDCLSEVFIHLDLEVLCVVADVCVQFRENARECYRRTQEKQLYLARKDFQPSKLLQTALLLRNFGSYFTELSMELE